jgi:hypothetical protein
MPPEKAVIDRGEEVMQPEKEVTVHRTTKVLNRTPKFVQQTAVFQERLAASLALAPEAVASRSQRLR